MNDMSNTSRHEPFDTKPPRPGDIPLCRVGPDALAGIPRLQTNPARWQGEGWGALVSDLRANNIIVDEHRAARALYVTDAGGIAYGIPHGVVIARSTAMVAGVMTAAQRHRIPVTVRGGGLTTEGEAVSFGGLQLDMKGMGRVLAIDHEAMTVQCEAGIYWHSLAESLRRQGLDYLCLLYTSPSPRD